jgi:hypothetical protein
VFKQALFALAAVTTLLVVDGHGQGGPISCVSGCNSFWTGYNWTTGTIAVDPYTCREGNTYWADIDETGECVAVDLDGPEPTAFFFSGCMCNAVCDACPAGQTCLYSCNTGVQGCTPITDQPRKECTGLNQ